MKKSIRILCRIDFASGPAFLWDGSGGPFVDYSGNKWLACRLDDSALDQIEAAMNAEATTISLTISGIDYDMATAIWTDYQADNIVGARVQLLLQDCDEFEQPDGPADVLFTGRIDNLLFHDLASERGSLSTIVVEITNRFSILPVTNGMVLSDADRKALSAVINPGAPPDRGAERVPVYVDQTIRWPNW